MFNAAKEIWEIFNSPNNEPIIVALIIGLITMIYAQVKSYLNCRARIKDKNDRIEDLVAQRNKFEDIALRNKGIKRKSSKE